MISEESLKTLKHEWIKRINNTSGIIYKYIQKDLIESFIKDIKSKQ